MIRSKIFFKLIQPDGLEAWVDPLAVVGMVECSGCLSGQERSKFKLKYTMVYLEGGAHINTRKSPEEIVKIIATIAEKYKPPTEHSSPGSRPVVVVDPAALRGIRAEKR